MTISSLSQQNNHIFTSGASGTNSAVIRGALRAERPEQLTVILPQSLSKQSQESQELLSQVLKNLKPSCESSNLLLPSQVVNLEEKPYNDHLPLIEASRYGSRRDSNGSLQ